MLEELEYNLWEHILSRLVDYGHAFSPEIEMAALKGDEALLLHGEAVNIDMALTTQVHPFYLSCLLFVGHDCPTNCLSVSRHHAQYLLAFTVVQCSWARLV